MPRESVYSDNGDFMASLTWDRDGIVQVSTGLHTARREKSLLHAMFNDEQLVKLGQLVDSGELSLGSGEDSYHDIGERLLDEMYQLMDSSWRSTYVTLSRPSCNKLIRALRRARDDAYGEDA